MATDTTVVGAKNLGSSGVLYDERRDFYISPQVVKELWTDVAPFLTVVANQGTISGMADPTFKMFEHRNPWQKQELTIDASTADTVVSSEGLVVGKNLIGLECEVWSDSVAEAEGEDFVNDNLKNEGVILITGIGTDGTSMTYETLSSDAITVKVGDKLSVIGNAQAEGSGSPVAWSDDLAVVFNQCQIFKTPVEVTGTLLQASLRGESKELARLRDQKASEHKIQKERAFLFGANPKGIKAGFAGLEDISDSNGMAIRTTMGIIPALEKHGNDDANSYSQNIFSIDASTDGAYDYKNFVEQMEKVFQYVPTAGMKRAFVGAGALGYWSTLGPTNSFSKNSGWEVGLSDMKRDALGFNYRMLETPHGMLQLIPTPALRGRYNKYMLVVDDSNLFHAQYRAPQFQASIQANDADIVKDQYMSDEGIGISMIESHSLFKIS